MTITLESISRCFQGLVPSTIATCSRDGTPNVTFLSQVYYVDSKHVALSCQFFNKTRRNVDENAHAMVEVYDPNSLQGYRLRILYLRSETSGPLFEAMSLRIQAIASLTGMEGVFRLLSADVYEVLEVEPVLYAADGQPAVPDATAPRQPSLVQVKGVQLISQQLIRSRDLDELLNTVLSAVDQLFGFHHAMVLVPDGSGRRLVTLASRGYGDEGVGAEVGIGEGFIGAVAEQRRVLRVSGVEGDLRYGRAIRRRATTVGGGVDIRPEIPLPGLPDVQSQLALPLVTQDRLVGVIAFESRTRMAFDDWDEALLELLTHQIATNMDRLAARDDEAAAAPPATATTPAPAKVPVQAKQRTFTLYRNDDCVFVDGEYLIRNVPGLILWKLLSAHQREGRTEFTNRELRLDESLKLPEARSNLESRLILLRKRLEQQCPDVRIVPVRRGKFALEVSCRVTLEERESA